MTDKHILQPVVNSPADANEPVIGEAIENLGQYLISTGKLASPEEFQRVRSNAIDIVRRCLPFSHKDPDRTGLIVGYVQSGKTMSMEAVVSLARDNGCRLVILLAGVTTNLLRQNAERFQKDLRTADGSGNWKIVSSSAQGVGVEDLRAACTEWRDDEVPESAKRTFVFAVLKNHSHLDWMRDLLKQVNLKGIPALIIDDEADQAGLNVAPDPNEESTTYARIRRLRECLPQHTYLQYTATPQAPLLISIDDLLSPDFAELVEPGTGYTGGEAFFAGSLTSNIVKSVPEADRFKPGEPPSNVPDSLVEAFATFIVGCAVARARKSPKLRSMLVHPSPRRGDHQRYLELIQGIRSRWSNELSDKDSPDREDALSEIRQGYKELEKTTEMPPFEELLPLIKVSILRMAIKLVNSEDASEVDWEGSEEHVLVGGEKLNRGYTVEGLTVTYMPRDAGGWNADTLQQRARFFGYKSKYLDLCRLYLHPDVIHAFKHYVEHERDIRKQLEGFRGRPLSEWRRAFFLDPKLRPTRNNVLDEPLHRTKADAEWWRQRFADEAAVSRNDKLVEDFLQEHTFTPASEWGGGKPHGVAVIPLAEAIRDLLSSYAVPSESWGLVAEVMRLTAIVDDEPDAEVYVVKMDDAEARHRAIDKASMFPLFQGRSSKKGGYEGDERVIHGHLPTIQIHRIQPKDTPARAPFYALALHVPAPHNKGVVVQQQNL